MAENMEKKQLEEIRIGATKAYNATNKLQKEIGYVNASLKKVDAGELIEGSTALAQSGEAAKDATKNTSGLVAAMDKIGQKMPNIKNAMEDIYKAIESHVFTQFTTKV